MPKHEKGHPVDSTGAGAGRDSYQSKAKGQHHQLPKKRQDGKGSGHGPEAHSEAGWKLEHSQTQGPING